MTTGAITHAKLQSNHHQQTNTQFFTGRMPFLSSNQQCQSTEGKNITFHGPAHLGSSNFVSDKVGSSWLSWGRFAMPLISPLMPVPHFLIGVFLANHLANTGSPPEITAMSLRHQLKIELYIRVYYSHQHAGDCFHCNSGRT